MVLASLDSARGTDATSPPEGPQDRAAPQKGRLSLQNAGEWGRARPGTARVYAVRAPRGSAWGSAPPRRANSRSGVGRARESAPERPRAMRWPGVTCCRPPGCGGVNKGCARMGRELALRCMDLQHSGRSLTLSLPPSPPRTRARKTPIPGRPVKGPRAPLPQPQKLRQVRTSEARRSARKTFPFARGAACGNGVEGARWGCRAYLCGGICRPGTGPQRPARVSAQRPAAEPGTGQPGSLPGSWERKPSAASRALARSAVRPLHPGVRVDALRAESAL